MRFASRQDAGRKLGDCLRERDVHPDLVLGLPRGGVVVAAEVAHLLHCPIDVLIVRKIGHPLHREFAVGAMAEHDVVLLDESSIGSTRTARADVEAIIREETERLRQYASRFHRAGSPDLRGKTVLVVDDGLATGATTEAGVLSARKQGATKVLLAVPVASTAGVRRLSRTADEVIALLIDPDFDAVGRYYEVFDQTADEEVLAILSAGHAHP
jgi:putative phosphoribosyl transferase